MSESNPRWNGIVNWLLLLSLTTTLLMEDLTFVEFSYFYTLVAVFNFVVNMNSMLLGAMAFFELIVVVQLLFAPAIQYAFFQGSEVSNLFYINMMVTEREYFGFAVYAILMLRILLWVGKDRLSTPIRIRGHEMRLKRFSLFLIASGLLGSIAFAILSLNTMSFVRVLVINLIPTGLLFLHIIQIQKGTSRFVLLSKPGIIFLLWFSISALGNAMFGQLLMWFLLFVLGSFEFRPQSLARRIVFIACGFICVLALQASKQTYRGELHLGRNSGLSTFYDALVQGGRTLTDESSMRFFQVNAHMRLNQGRILSHVIEKCDREGIRENGKRLGTNILASVVPRIIWKDKPMAGGDVNIQKYTSVNLNSNTNMNISPLGDFYIDFGPFWAIIFSGVFGFLIRSLMRSLMQLYENDDRWLPFIPFLLSGVLVIETDFLSVLNFTVKSMLFLSFCLWIHRLLGGLRHRDAYENSECH